jgi:hypothetical protein
MVTTIDQTPFSSFENTGLAHSTGIPRKPVTQKSMTKIANRLSSSFRAVELEPCLTCSGADVCCVLAWGASAFCGRPVTIGGSDMGALLIGSRVCCWVVEQASGLVDSSKRESTSLKGGPYVMLVESRYALGLPLE